MKRLLLTPIRRTTSRARAERSFFVWRDDGTGVYTLSPLGIINGVRRALHLSPWMIQR